MDKEETKTPDMEDDMDNILLLSDEDGNDVQFEFLELIDYDEEEYVVLLPVEDESEDEIGEVVILKVEQTESEDQESYVGVEDEEVLNKVFEIFKEKFKDEFDYVDDEDEENK